LPFHFDRHGSHALFHENCMPALICFICFVLAGMLVAIASALLWQGCKLRRPSASKAHNRTTRLAAHAGTQVRRDA
jgi:hypothetical protein